LGGFKARCNGMMDGFRIEPEQEGFEQLVHARKGTN
jgi:hypothetical protein